MSSKSSLTHKDPIGLSDGCLVWHSTQSQHQKQRGIRIDEVSESL